MLKPLNKGLLLLFSIIILYFTSCSDVIEKSIKDQNVSIIYPSNNSMLTDYAQTFWWTEVDNALHYRLELVKGRFDSVQKFILDSTLTKTSFSCVLEPGNYQLRIKAENGSTSTPYTTHSFKIDTSSINIQKIILLSPTTNSYKNTSQILFTWNPMFGAGSYRLQIDTAGFIDETNLVFDESVVSTSTVVNLNSDHLYQWRVRAESENKTSKWSDNSLLTIDKESPDAPLIISPVNNMKLNLPVTLTWNEQDDVNKYELYVYKSDSISLYDASFPLIVYNNYLLSLGQLNEKIIWRLRSIDKAGNKSSFSNYGSYTIK